MNGIKYDVVSKSRGKCILFLSLLALYRPHSFIPMGYNPAIKPFTKFISNKFSSFLCLSNFFAFNRPKEGREVEPENIYLLRHDVSVKRYSRNDSNKS